MRLEHDNKAGGPCRVCGRHTFDRFRKCFRHADEALPMPEPQPREPRCWSPVVPIDRPAARWRFGVDPPDEDAERRAANA